MLLDTGCTTTILSTHTFQQLPPTIREKLDAVPGSAQAANGDPIATHGWLPVKGRLRHYPLQYTFLVADVQEDVILGLDFLTHVDAIMDFRTAELVLGNK